MDRGFSMISFLLGSLLVIGLVTGGGYILIRQTRSVQSADHVVVNQAKTEIVAPTEQSSQADVGEKKPYEQMKVETKIAPTQTAPASGGFSVRKVPPGFVLDVANEEPTLLLSVTTEPRSEDPKTLSLCMTLTDEMDVAVSETDCVPLEKYGTWSQMTNYDLSLAPHPDRMDYWVMGHHPSRVRFELVAGKINDYSEAPARSRYTLLASDNTGTFDFYLHE